MDIEDLLPIDNYIRDSDVSKVYLAKNLIKGTLALVIGAGVSKSFGLPLWSELVKRCLKKVNLDDEVNESTSVDDLRLKMEKVEDKVGDPYRYREIVRDCLYQGLDFSDYAVIKNDLLISFGALLMGSQRGSIHDVVSYNFDDLLEWYLNLHGYKTQVIKDLPSLFQNASDVRIYHPHGFLPKIHPDSPSNFLIFSQMSYDKMGEEFYRLWRNLSREILLQKVVIFVGLSGEDAIFGPMLVEVMSKIEKTRLTGFWLFGSSVKKDKIDYFKKRNIVPLCFNSYKEIPKFILQVCQKAAELSI